MAGIASNPPAALSADLSNKVALVTGASSGIGEHFARTLARNGARVVLAARRAERLEALATQIRADGGEAAPLKLDVSSIASITSASAEAESAFGPIDVLINNSGVTVGKPAIEQTEEDWDRVLDTNVRGAFFMSTWFARRMIATQRPGAIINVASILGLRQAGMVAPYAASKAALIQLTKTLALEFARYNIRVNAIAPGYIESDLNREWFTSEAGQALIRRIPQRRLGTVADLDGTLLLLASDAARYMTGSVIVVDGGHLTSTL
jgi:NAD(P)-dependent dehydrogenase (short-subunit alcohol dehydrogenase family)